MKITRVDETKIHDTPHGMDVRRLYDRENAQAVHITLQPGESLKPHITPVDVFFYILEGTPEVLVGDEKVTAGSDTLIESPRDIPHCLYNNSQSISRILVVKAPKPVNQSRIL